MTKVKYVKSGKCYTVEFYAENGKFYDYAIQTVKRMWNSSLYGSFDENCESNGMRISDKFKWYSDGYCDKQIEGVEWSLINSKISNSNLEAATIDNIIKWGNPSTFRLSDIYKRFRTGVGGYDRYHSQVGCHNVYTVSGNVVKIGDEYVHSKTCDDFCRAHFGTTCKYLEKYTDEQIDKIATISRAGKDVMLWTGDVVKAQEGIDIPVVGQGFYVWENKDKINNDKIKSHDWGCDSECKNGVHSAGCNERAKKVMGYTIDELKALSFEQLSTIEYNKQIDNYNKQIDNYNKQTDWYVKYKERCRKYIDYVYNTPYNKLDGYTKAVWLLPKDFAEYNDEKEWKWYWCYYDTGNHASDLFKVWKDGKVEGVCSDLATCCAMLMKVTGIDINARIVENDKENHAVAVFTLTQPYYEGIMPKGERRYCGRDASYEDEYGEKWESEDEYGLDTRKGKKVTYCFSNAIFWFYGNYSWYWSNVQVQRE